MAGSYLVSGILGSMFVSWLPVSILFSVWIRSVLYMVHIIWVGEPWGQHRGFHGRRRHLCSGANTAKFTVNVWENRDFNAQ